MTEQERRDRYIARVCILILLVLAVLKIMSISPDTRKSIGFLLAFALFFPRYIQLILVFILFKVIGWIFKFIAFAIS